MIVDVIPNGTDVIGHLFRERECLSNQPTATLAQRIVEPLDTTFCSVIVTERGTAAYLALT
jgi:hypothetical protein